MQEINIDNPKLQRILQISDLKIPNFMVNQIEFAIYEKGITNYSQISTIPLAIREKIAANLHNDKVLSLDVVKEFKGEQSYKVLFQTTNGGQKIEAVLMTYLPNKSRQKTHKSLCISSQSGCALACTFCATGAIGLKRNLTAEEITDQVLYFKQHGHKIDSIVFMGMGEPFANPHIFDALNILTNEKMFAMSARRISVSTVGIIPGLKRFIDEYSEMNLAFSLHSPFPAERLSIMPVTRSYPIDEVLSEIKRYIDKTNNRVFIAYILLKGINDSPRHAKALADLIKSQGAKHYLYHVNLIRFHPGSTIEKYDKPFENSVKAFSKILDAAGISCTIRQSFGIDIDGACGQLYGEYDKSRSRI